MPKADQPTVLITRPAVPSAHFLSALRQETLAFSGIISPAFEIEPTTATVSEFEQAVFTSASAVEFSPPGCNRIAWCVGSKTAATAQLKGYDARSASGDASDLLRLILRERPAATLLHMRGETSVGNISAELNARNLKCSDVVVYRKAKQPPTSQVLSISNIAIPIILPVFSAETVSIIDEWGCRFRRPWIVAISDAVASAAHVLDPEFVRIAERPNAPAMVSETASLIA